MNNKVKKNPDILGKYLIKKGVNTPLRMQKMLFFLRVEEKNSEIVSEYFNIDLNFEAWINGPVNVDTYKLFKAYFWDLDEKEEFILSDEKEKEIDPIYLKFYEKYESFSTEELVKLSHENIGWINARGNTPANEPSQEKIEEKYLLNNNK